jgi:DNA-binding CsgD family transcriptional regulator
MDYIIAAIFIQHKNMQAPAKVESAIMRKIMDTITDLILTKMPVGAIVFDQNMDVVYVNRQATVFLKRFELPCEVVQINRRIFDAMEQSRLEELFPGEIYLSKKLEGSPNNWTFKFFISENPGPFISIFIIEEKISNKLEMNRIRQLYRLTRRETDILRRTLDGLKNIEIADDLEISEQTVKDHLSNIYTKMGIENRFELIRFLVGPLDSASQ